MRSSCGSQFAPETFKEQMAYLAPRQHIALEALGRIYPSSLSIGKFFNQVRHIQVIACPFELACFDH